MCKPSVYNNAGHQIENTLIIHSNSSNQHKIYCHKNFKTFLRQIILPVLGTGSSMSDFIVL